MRKTLLTLVPAALIALSATPAAAMPMDGTLGQAGWPSSPQRITAIMAAATAATAWTRYYAPSYGYGYNYGYYAPRRYYQPYYGYGYGGYGYGRRGYRW